MAIYYFYFYVAMHSVLIIHYISDLLLDLMEWYFEWANFVPTQNTWVTVFFIVFVSRWPVRCSLTLMAQLNALYSLPQQEAPHIWKRSAAFLERHSSGLKKPNLLYHYVENAPLRWINQYNQPSECLQKCSQMYRFSEQNVNLLLLYK